MTWETWAKMLIVLALNWGGFIGLRAYGVRRENGKGCANAAAEQQDTE